MSAAKTTNVVDSKSQVLPKPRRRRANTQPLFGVTPAQSTRSGLPSLFAGRTASSAKAGRTLTALAAVDGGWEDFVPKAAQPDRSKARPRPDATVLPAPRRRRGPSAAELAAKRLANAAAESLARAAQAHQAQKPVQDKPQPVAAPVPTAGKPVVAKAKAKGPRFLAMGSIPPQIESKSLPSLFSVIDNKPKAAKSGPARAASSTVPPIQSAARPPVKAAITPTAAVPPPRDPEPELDDDLDALHVQEEEWYASITRAKSRSLPPAVVVEPEPAAKPQLVVVDDQFVSDADRSAVPEPIGNFVAEPAPVQQVSAPAMAEQFSKLESDFFAAGEQLAETAEFAPVEDFGDLEQPDQPKRSLWRRLRGRN